MCYNAKTKTFSPTKHPLTSLIQLWILRTIMPYSIADGFEVSVAAAGPPGLAPYFTPIDR